MRTMATKKLSLSEELESKKSELIDVGLKSSSINAFSFLIP